MLKRVLTVRLPELATLIPALLKLPTTLRNMEKRIMAQLDALRQQMADGFVAVGEIATDLDDLIARLANGEPNSEEVAAATAEATALTQGLKDLAAKHTPPAA